MMNNIVGNCFVIVCLLCATSCGHVEERWDTKSSFSDNRSLYDEIIADIQQYRDESECFEKGCKIDIPEQYINEKLTANFYVAGVISTAPLVIKFQPVDGIYAYILYAETQESEDYIKNMPNMNPSAYTAKEMEEHWFLVTLDWN